MRRWLRKAEIAKKKNCINGWVTFPKRRAVGVYKKGQKNSTEFAKDKKVKLLRNDETFE